MPNVAAKPARRPLPALNTARYVMFGPAVSSITRQVRAKAPKCLIGYSEAQLPLRTTFSHHGFGCPIVLFASASSIT